jgi:SAM-dependent methyltransferase
MKLPDRVIAKKNWLLRKKIKRNNFKNEFILFKKKSSDRFELNWNETRPYLDDKTATTGFDAHYIYHPAWASRIVKNINPAFHIDVSSTLHFCTQLSAFIPVRFYDFRPAQLNLDNMLSDKADLTNLFFESDSVESISCMHTVEHIGLGRYGDALDPDGDLKAIAELKRVVKPGGSLLFVVPVGKPKVIFNAHRIYDAAIIADIFNDFVLQDFSLVKDNAEFVNNVPVKTAAGQAYGCGCFWFIKK